MFKQKILVVLLMGVLLSGCARVTLTGSGNLVIREEPESQSRLHNTRCNNGSRGHHARVDRAGLEQLQPCHHNWI